jgi:hypothetical protein
LILEKWSEGLSDVNKFVNNQPSIKKYKSGKLIAAGCNITTLLEDPDGVKAQAKKVTSKHRFSLVSIMTAVLNLNRLKPGC